MEKKLSSYPYDMGACLIYDKVNQREVLAPGAVNSLIAFEVACQLGCLGYRHFCRKVLGLQT